jgi:TolB protein
MARRAYVVRFHHPRRHRALGAVTVAAALVVAATMSAPSSGAVLAPEQSAPEGGTQIVWSRFTDADPSAANIVSKESATHRVRELTHNAPGVADIDPAISPDGRRVAFERDLPDGSTRIGLVDANGLHERLLDLGCADPCAVDLTPTWSPEGRHLVFTRVVGPFDAPNESARSAVLMTTDLTGMRITRLSERGIDGAYEDYRASFSPDGYVVFVRVRNSDGLSAVYRMSPRGRHVRRLTPWALDADLPWVSPATSGPTEDLIVFETFGHGAPEGQVQAVATVPGDCPSVAACAEDIKVLTDRQPDLVANFNPTWSPNGMRVAFVRFEALEGQPPRGDIWTMRWNGKHKRAVSRSPQFEFRPSWGVAPPHREH